MSSAISRFSATFSRLSSMERWFIIIVGVGVFALVNFMFIFPRFNDWGALKKRLSKAETLKQEYEAMIEQGAVFQSQIRKLESETAAVPAEDQAVNFLNAIQSQAAQSRVSIVANNRQPERTNQFFVERAQALTTQSGEAELVDFLYNLGAGNSQIRARALSISRDQTQTQLRANMTLIASFQKKAPRSAPRPSGVTAAPAATTTPVAGNNTNVSRPLPSAVRTNVPPPAAGPKIPTPQSK